MKDMTVDQCFLEHADSVGRMFNWYTPIDPAEDLKPGEEPATHRRHKVSKEDVKRWLHHLNRTTLDSVYLRGGRMAVTSQEDRQRLVAHLCEVSGLPAPQPEPEPAPPAPPVEE